MVLPFAGLLPEGRGTVISCQVDTRHSEGYVVLNFTVVFITTFELLLNKIFSLAFCIAAFTFSFLDKGKRIMVVGKGALCYWLALCHWFALSRSLDDNFCMDGDLSSFFFI